MIEEQPWDAAIAEKYIRQLACDDNLALTKTEHSAQQMRKRCIIEYDIFYVLKHGKVLAEKTERSTQEGYFKYAIQSKAPNSEGVIRLIVIPCVEKIHMTLITVMWVENKREME